MGAKITVSVRGPVLAAVTALAVLAAYLIGSASRGGTPASAAEDTPARARTMVMAGTGESIGVPDQLTFRLSVNKKADDVAVALHDANATMRQVLAGLKEAGVAKKDVQTTGLSVRPDYEYRSNAPPVLSGYVVRESAAVIVRDLGKSGTALTTAVRAGGNSVRVHGLGLRIGDRDALMSKARDAAVLAARTKAEQYADATGQTLGAVLSLKEIHATPAQTYGIRSGLARSFDAAASKVPIRSGSEDLKVTVSVVWQL